MTLSDKIQKAVDSIRLVRAMPKPRVGIILGSGFSQWINTIQVDCIIPYKDIDGFPQTTVVGHDGQLILGSSQSIPIIVMQGRFHFYEGHEMDTLSMPVRVFRDLGVEVLIITNAAGAINVAYKPGDLMIIEDHINFSGTNPLIGPNLEKYGTRFPDASNIYAPRLIKLALSIGAEMNLELQQGVYLFTTGPSFETPAEIRMMRNLGADAVGMSTVPEAVVANHAGMEVFGLSLLSNMASGLSKVELSHDEVMSTMSQVATQVNDFINMIIKRL